MSEPPRRSSARAKKPTEALKAAHEQAQAEEERRLSRLASDEAYKKKKKEAAAKAGGSNSTKPSTAAKPTGSNRATAPIRRKQTGKPPAINQPPAKKKRVEDSQGDPLPSIQEEEETKEEMPPPPPRMAQYSQSPPPRAQAKFTIEDSDSDTTAIDLPTGRYQPKKAMDDESLQSSQKLLSPQSMAKGSETDDNSEIGGIQEQHLPLNQQDEDEDEEEEHPEPITLEELYQTNPPIFVQLNLHKGRRGKPKFQHDNILLCNQEKMQRKLKHAKLFNIKCRFRADFPSQVLPAINECIQTNLPQYELDNMDGYSIYHRGDPLEVSYEYFEQWDNDIMECKQPFSIATHEDWKIALFQSGSHMSYKTQSVRAIWINLLCHVKPVAKRRSSQQQRSSQDMSQQIGFAQEPNAVPEQPVEDEYWKSLLFGWNITLKLCIQGSSYQREGTFQKYQLQSKNTEFSPEEVVLMKPPYEADFLEALSDGSGIGETRHRLKNIVELVKAKAFGLPSYKNQDGTTLIGENSWLYLQPNFSNLDTMPMKLTSQFWESVKRRYDGLKSSARDQPVEIRVSIGAMSEDDTPYTIPKFFHGDGFFDRDASSDEEEIDYTTAPIHVSPGRVTRAAQEGMLSQNSNKVRPEPPVIPSNKTGAQRRAEQTLSVPQAEEYVWNLHINPTSKLHHGLTLETAKVLKAYFMQYRKDGKAIHEMFPCVNGEPSTWPPLSLIPESIRANPAVHLQPIAKGSFPPQDDNEFGSYQTFKKSPQQMEEDENNRRQSAFRDLIGAVSAAMRPQSVAGSTSFVIRIELDHLKSSGAEERYEYVHVNTTSPETLAQLFDRNVVRARVRNGFRIPTVHFVRSGSEEVILNYTNHQDKSIVYATYPMAELASVTVADLIESLPRDKNGLKKEAAFPVLLVVSTRPVLIGNDADYCI